MRPTKEQCDKCGQVCTCLGHETSVDKAIKGARSPALRTSLKLKPGDPKQAHHLVPLELLKTNPVVQAAVKAGFLFNDGDMNGLAEYEDFHLEVDNETKRKSHPQYTSLVLAAIEHWAAEHPNFSDEEAKAFVTGLAQEWRGNYKSAEDGDLPDDPHLRKEYERLNDALWGGADPADDEG